ncbi:MAG: MFS transporter [Acidimicrobiales bacterium]
MSTTNAIQPHSQKHSTHRLALVVIAAAQLMVMLDLTIVNIALPSIQRELGFSLTNLTWVIDAYVLVFGGILLLGGRTGDLFGRRRMFAVGIALFTLASLAGGLATDQAWLITARAVQGVGAAIASPTALSLIAVTFDEGTERHRAMAVYAAMSAAGGALGLLLGGILVDIASWRWVMFVNVPIGLAVLAAIRPTLPATSSKRGNLDIPGAITVSAGVASIVYGFIHAPTAGWTNPTTLGAFGIGIVVLAGFAVLEHRTPQPLVPLTFLVNRSRAATYAIMLLLGAAMLSLIYFLTQFLQNALHYSPIVAGAAYLPIPFTVALTGVVVSKQIRRFGTRPFLTLGPACVAAGLFWVSFITQHSSYLSVFGPLVIVGFGMGLSFVPLTLRAVSSVEPHQSGLASALLNTSQQIGGSLGLAALVTVAATASRSYLTHIGHTGSQVALQLSAAVHGDQTALKAAALGAALAFVLAVTFIRSNPQSSSQASPATM